MIDTIPILVIILRAAQQSINITIGKRKEAIAIETVIIPSQYFCGGITEGLLITKQIINPRNIPAAIVKYLNRKSSSFSFSLLTISLFVNFNKKQRIKEREYNNIFSILSTFSMVLRFFGFGNYN